MIFNIEIHLCIFNRICVCVYIYIIGENYYRLVVDKSWVGKIPCGRAWQSTPVFLPGDSHGQRSLAGYSPWDRKE